MRFALVMPTYIYRPERAALADAGFRTLARTRWSGEKPLLILLTKGEGYDYPIGTLASAFDVLARPQQGDNGTEFRGISQPLVYGTDLAFAGGADVAVHVNDDSLFHPDWLLQLEALVRRRPSARAWSVYRSAHTAVHAELAVDGPDVRVRSINGNGLAICKSEWSAWAQDWRAHAWPDDPRPSVMTLDCRHALERPGERWVTATSYVEHTGRDGVHCQPGIPEWAINFAGTGEAP